MEHLAVHAFLVVAVQEFPKKQELGLELLGVFSERAQEVIVKAVDVYKRQI